MNKETKIIFRIENPTHMNGMWYNSEGIATKTIDKLCPYGQAKTFPMPLNLDLHRFDKKIWNSAGKSIENMNFWFDPRDTVNLFNNGFKLFEFEVNEFQELENEILFTRQGIISQKEIPLEKIWNILFKKLYNMNRKKIIMLFSTLIFLIAMGYITQYAFRTPFPILALIPIIIIVVMIIYFPYNKYF